MLMATLRKLAAVLIATLGAGAMLGTSWWHDVVNTPYLVPVSPPTTAPASTTMPFNFDDVAFE